MPFTASHAAAAAPFARFGFNLSALVIGSFSPDFIYFILLAPLGHSTHTIQGVFLFCVPAGLGVLWVYHSLLKAPLAALFPDPLGKALLDPNPQHRVVSIRRLPALAASVALGAFTHLLWDGFTHESGWALTLLPFLKVNVIDLGFEQVPFTRVLHHASSLVGLVWIALKARAHLNGCGCGKREILRSATTSFVFLSGAAVLGILYVWMQGQPITGFDELRRSTIRALIASGTFLSAILACYGILWRIMKARAAEVEKG